ncbi:glycosyltransferase family 4 protein [Nostoc sp. C117]|uniref:glycosyltransferase family 4 protein n=1 Tax=Nostoc sp. C117 TaxID=3349875 RepID=UPI00370D4561
MNVLHINQSDITGGAAIAGYRLHQSLLAQNIDSRLLVGHVNTSSDRVATVPLTKQRLENHIYRFTGRLGLNQINLLRSFDILKHSFYKQSDVLNFHNIHTNYFNYLAIPSLTANKPAVFTLHDMWSFTGHCAYSYDCERWKIGCGKCPYPDTYPAIARDNTRLEWKLKNWVYRNSNLSIITPSNWLTQQAKQSLLKEFPIHHIPNGIDIQAYQVLDPEHCRSLLGIPLGKKVLMFGAQSIKDSRKGGDLLFKTLQSLPESLKAETVLLTIGNGDEIISKAVGMVSLNLGYVSSDRLKSIAYSAADLFIFPTRADNLPLVLQESMACGTPLVSFKVGGVPDLVRPDITGYLALLEDPQDLSNGIVQLLEDTEQRNSMGKNCRDIILKEYTLELQTQRYIELYHKVLEN